MALNLHSHDKLAVFRLRGSFVFKLMYYLLHFLYVLLVKINNKFKLVNIDRRIILERNEFSLMKEKYLSHYRTIGKNVKELRLGKGWTQVELASRCSVNAEQISRIENARRDYMHSTLLEVCEALGVSIFEIMKPDE